MPGWAVQMMKYVLPALSGEAANYRGTEVRNMEIGSAVILGEGLPVVTTK
jgi:hypothetical protein